MPNDAGLQDLHHAQLVHELPAHAHARAVLGAGVVAGLYQGREWESGWEGCSTGGSRDRAGKRLAGLMGQAHSFFPSGWHKLKPYIIISPWTLHSARFQAYGQPCVRPPLKHPSAALCCANLVAPSCTPCLSYVPQYGKDYYYRAHPEDLRKFYGMVDEFHRMWDVLTEFDSLSSLASQLLPSECRNNRVDCRLVEQRFGVANGLLDCPAVKRTSPAIKRQAWVGNSC